MSSSEIRPNSLDGIKRLATRIKRERNIKHTAALDVASKQAGYENIRHAQRALGSTAPVKKCEAFVTAYWKEPGSWENGRETIRLALSKPLREILTGPQLRIYIGARDFKLAGPDHFESRKLLPSQRHARELVCQVARAVQFVAATGMLPSNAPLKAHPGGVSLSKLPGLDHQRLWVDPKSKRYLLTDEPYSGGEVTEARAKWAQQHGCKIAAAGWPGMFSPPGSSLFLVSQASGGVDIDVVLRALSKAPEPVLAEPWTGESAPTMPPFVSPSKSATLGARKPRAEAIVRPRAGSVTVPYKFVFGGVYRRPKGAMPLAGHRQIATELASILPKLEARPGAFNRLNVVRAELDEWVQREYSVRELPAGDFHRLYYPPEPKGWPKRLLASEKVSAIENLRRVQSMLKQHYLDCTPVRELIGKVEHAISSIEKWKLPKADRSRASL